MGSLISAGAIMMYTDSAGTLSKKKIMKNAVKMAVEFTAEANYGKNWLEAKG